jgi:hypothetical protein
MIARLLERLGVFLGWRKQADHEAYFFLKLNEWLMRQCGASWDRPTPMRDLLGHPGVRQLVVDYLRISLHSPRSISYLGPMNYLRYRSPGFLPHAWGWKDPRTTFTLPIWLELFPEAKVIHAVRHGVDVANSLRERAQATLQARRQRFHRLRPIYRIHAKQVGFAVGLRCTSLDEGFVLWEEYMGQAREHLAERGSRGIEIRYEDFLVDPRQGARRLADFVGLRARESDIGLAVGDSRRERAYAYRTAIDPTAFAHDVHDRLMHHGYSGRDSEA